MEVKTCLGVSLDPSPMSLRQWVERRRERFQEARADLFCALMHPSAGALVLDLGGNRGDFSRRLLNRMHLELTVADLLDFSKECQASGLKFVQVSEGGRLPFEDNSFDFVFCNSVIEHVTIPKDECRRLDLSDEEWTRRASVAQQTFAREIIRVGRNYFVQTPHPAFPFDLHTWLPFTSRLGHRNTVRLTKWTQGFWIKKSWEADWNLIDPDSMQNFFPDAHIHIERFLGMPKSLIAYKSSGP